MDYGRVVASLKKVTKSLGKPRPDEALAAITHWLQNQDRIPPHCDNDLVDKWRIALRADVGFDLSSASPIESDSMPPVPFPPPLKAGFTFSDLFAGIGGFRLALQKLGGRCVFACEWDKSAKMTYFRNFGVVPYGDIKQFTGETVSDEELDRLIPDHDVLAAGFPCQPFSLAGMPARNHYRIEKGLSGSQGNAFFDLARIARVKKPQALFLENVRNILSIDHGDAFRKIRGTIEDELGYEFHYSVIDSSTVVPQRRKRCYIVAFRASGSEFQFPGFDGSQLSLSSILESDVPERYTISDKLWNSHKERSERNLRRGTGFTVTLADVAKPSPTIVARYGKDGKECLIPQEGRNPRKLTPVECGRLLGFPESFVHADSDAAAYRQFGNAIPVPVVEIIGRNMIDALQRRKKSIQEDKMNGVVHQRTHRLF